MTLNEQSLRMRNLQRFWSLSITAITNQSI